LEHPLERATEQYLPSGCFDPILYYPRGVFAVQSNADRKGFNRELVAIAFIPRGSFMGFYGGMSRRTIAELNGCQFDLHIRYCVHCVNGILDPLSQWDVEDSVVQNPLIFADEPAANETATMFADDVLVDGGNAFGLWAASDIYPGDPLTWLYGDEHDEQIKQLHRQHPIAYTPGKAAARIWPRQNPYHLFPDHGLFPERVCFE
jgi:hypothetical protein